jgi:hypothetical protein
MIAKLMTERPTHLRVLRDTVPPAVDAAVAKALAKTPIDRFATAGDFVRAMDDRTAGDGDSRARSPRRRVLTAVGLLTVVAIAAGGAYAMRGRLAPSVSGAVLGQKTQLTATGALIVPAISGDGKQLAFLNKQCANGTCRFSVVVQDVGGSTTRTIFEGATSGYYLEWSPDRRNLIFAGTVGGRAGTYLLSALGGTPRFLTAGTGTFYAGGDSLLLGPQYHSDSVYWIKVAGLDGVGRDSIRLVGRGEGLAAISNVPGTNWIVTMILQEPHGFWQVIDRGGKVADHVVNACTCGGVATSDAVWIARQGDALEESIVRVAIDRNSGRLSTHQDTMITALFTNFSLTADGSGLVMDEGTYDFSVWSLAMADVLKGRYAEDRRVAHASTAVSATLSPDGSRLLVRRVVPTGGGHAGARFSVMPFNGGSEVPISGAGAAVRVSWADSVTVAVSSRTPTGSHHVQIDVLSGAQRNAMDLSDSTVTYIAALPDGWAWVPPTGDRVLTKRGGKTREYPKPAWYSFIYEVAPDPAHDRVYIDGPNLTTGDSLGVSVLSLSDGATTQWSSTFAERGHVQALSDGSAFLQLSQSLDALSFFKLTGPGQVQSLGASPRPIRAISVSADMSRATVYERDYRADAWISKVVRQ